MKVTLNWLKQYVDFDWSPEALAGRLTMLGLEVESVRKVAGDFEGYVHWLSISDGRLLGRIKIAKSPIETKPVVVDGIVYVYAKDGTLAALKAR